MEVLTDDEIAARIAALSDDEPTAETRAYKFVRPLSTISQSLIEALRVEDGIGTGLAALDVLTRGFRPTDLILITGFAHSGKTQLVNTMIVNNPHKHVLFFSLDDPAEMILAKLVAMHSGMSAERVEARVRDNDAATIRLVQEVAAEHFPNLIVVDDVIGMPSMTQAIDEAEDFWGCDPDAVIIDYVEMMPGGAATEDQGANIKQKINDLKAWAKTCNWPLIVLHQGTRSKAAPGEPIGITSMGYSGEQQATQIIGCRRKRDKEDLEAWERTHHENTITIHLVKNKRPGGKLTHYEGLDFHMEPSTGLITPEREPGNLLDVVAQARQQVMDVT